MDVGHVVKSIVLHHLILFLWLESSTTTALWWLATLETPRWLKWKYEKAFIVSVKYYARLKWVFQSETIWTPLSSRLWKRGRWPIWRIPREGIWGQHEPKEWHWNQRNVLHCTSQSTELKAEIHLKCRKRIRSRSYNFTLKIHVCQFHTSDNMFTMYTNTVCLWLEL